MLMDGRHTLLSDKTFRIPIFSLRFYKMKILNLVIIVISFFLINQLSAQKSERIGIIDMEYILSKMEDYTTASQQLEEKIGEWKREIELKSKYIENLK